MMKSRVGFSAGGSVASEELAHVFDGLNIEVVAHDSSERVHANIYLSESFVSPPLSNEDAYASFLSKFILQYCDHYIPFIDSELLLCHEIAASCPSIATKILISDATTIRICNDKLITKKMLSEAGIPIVRLALKAPAFLKPRLGSGGKYGLVIKDNESLCSANKIAEREHLLLEEYVEGPIISVDALWSKEGGLLKTAQRLRSKGSGVSTESSSQTNAKLRSSIDESINFAGKILAFRGLTSFQFLIKENQPLLLEINPRMGGSVGHSHLLGSEILCDYFQIALGSGFTQEPYGNLQPYKARKVVRFFHDKTL